LCLGHFWVGLPHGDRGAGSQLVLASFGPDGVR
jgi:hypothetical protein